MRKVVAFLLLAGAGAASPTDFHLWRDATDVKGRHYVVRTNTYPELARDLVTTLDRSYALFEDRFGPLAGRARLPMRVHLHRTREEYLDEGEGIAGALGHFDPSLDTCVLVWRGGTGEAGWPIAVHEACHQYIRRRHGRIGLPSWYAEGIACWFEGLQTKRTSDRVSRLRFAAAVAASRAGEARIETVLDGRSLVRNGKLRVSGISPARYYGLAWSLVHFLATDERYRNAFRRFELRLFAARPSTREAASIARDLLRDECGSLSTLEVEWRKHIDALPQPPEIVAPAVYRWDLASEHAYTRYSALRNLQRARLPMPVIDRVYVALDDSDVIVRTEATRLFEQQARADGDWPKSVPAILLRSVDAGDPGLKRAALGALAHPDMSAAVPHLMAETDEREARVYALARMNDVRTFPVLRKAALDLNIGPRARSACIRTLASDPDARDVLMRATGSPERGVRRLARAALMRLDGRLADVEDRQAKNASDAALAAATEAVHMGGTRAIVRIALDPSARSIDRVHACLLLGTMRSRDSVPALRRLCRPGIDSAVRLEALRSLVRITGETQGYRAAQRARDREAVFRRWASG